MQGFLFVARSAPLLLLLLISCANALDLSTRAPSFLAARAPSCRSPPAVLQQAAAASADTTAAASQLLAEVAKEQRSLPAIASLVATLEAAPPPPKLKKAVLGDWKLTFASDEAAVGPFTTGAADGKFVVLEEVLARMADGSKPTITSVEVIRRIGPFGNSASSLNGFWSLSEGSSSGGGGGSGGGKKGGKGGKGKGKGGGKGMQATAEPAAAQAAEAGPAGALSWRTSYMIDERGREVDPPKEMPTSHKASVTHVSKDLMVLRVGTAGAASPSYCVFTKLAKGDLKKTLESEYSVYGVEAILGEPEKASTPTSSGGGGGGDGGGGFKLPELPKELPGGVKMPELPKELPKIDLPKFPFGGN